MSDDEILEKLCNGLTPAIITREAHGDTYNWCMCVSEGAIAILRSLGWGPVGEARDKALEEAANACDSQQKMFLSDQYAAHQPLSSMSERFGCKSCAAAIRALKGNG